MKFEEVQQAIYEGLRETATRIGVKKYVIQINSTDDTNNPSDDCEFTNFLKQRFLKDVCELNPSKQVVVYFQLQTVIGDSIEEQTHSVNRFMVNKSQLTEKFSQLRCVTKYHSKDFSLVISLPENILSRFLPKED